MKQYEVTFIVDPVLSGDEIKSTAQTYIDMVTKAKCTIVHNDEMDYANWLTQSKNVPLVYITV